MRLDRRALLAGGSATALSMLAQRAFAQQPGEDIKRPDAPYEGSQAEGKLRIVNLQELEEQARKVLPEGGFGYISGGAGANWTRDENMRAFQRVRIEPQALSGVSKVDLTTQVLGSRLSMPIFIPPMGSHGLAHVKKEEASSPRRPCPGHFDGHVDAIQSQHGRDRRLQSRAEMVPDLRAIGPRLSCANCASAPRLRAIPPSRRQSTTIIPSRAKKTSATLFARPPRSGKGNMPRTISDPTEATRAFDGRKRDLNWDDLDFIKKEFGGAVIVKGVMSPRVAAKACERGMDAVYVSNHGGRAFDGVEASIDALPRIAAAVNGRAPIIFDSGVRRGADVFRALALGATVVGCGRPVLYGMALGGQAGAQSVLEYLRDSLTVVMRLAGTAKISDISKDYLALPPARD